MSENQKYLRQWRREPGDDWVVGLAFAHLLDSSKALSLTAEDAEQLEATLRATDTTAHPTRVSEHEGYLYVARTAMGTDSDEGALREVIDAVDKGLIANMVPARLALARLDVYSPALADMPPPVAYDNMTHDRTPEANDIFEEVRMKAIDHFSQLLGQEIDSSI